jgi:hypothetical protein
MKVIEQHPIQWLHSQFIGSIPNGNEICYLCGASCTKQHSVTKGIADTFNSHYLAKVPSSSVLCSACWWYFNDKEHPEFRKMSLVVCCDSWQNWQREAMKSAIERWLHDGLEADSYLVVSLSKKKHILLQAQMNAAGSRELAIQVEEQVAHLSLDIWQQIDTAFMNLLILGHNKGEILSGDLYGQTLRKHGRLAEAMMHSQQLEPWRKSPQIELLSYTTIYEKGQEAIDGSTARNDILRERTGDQKDSVSTPQSRVERDRQRVPQQVPHGDLENVRGKSSNGSKDHEQLSLFSF